MAIWKVDIFEDAETPYPVRRGYIDADNENEAIQRVMEAVESSASSDLYLVATEMRALPNGLVLWDEL